MGGLLGDGVFDKTLSEFLNAYMAIESLLSSRYISDETRQKACEALKALNQQLAQLLEENKSKAADTAA